MIDELLTDPDATGVGVVFCSDVGRAERDGPGVVAQVLTDLADRWGLAEIIRTPQVHSATVHVVDEAWLATNRLGDTAPGDAMVTTLRNSPPLALCIRVADCVPVAFADAAAGVVGAAHAGRVGFDTGVLANTVAEMRALGARDITAWIGPHICGGCYEVPQDMHDDVAARHPAAAATTTWGTPALDLGAGCEEQLRGLGVDVVRVDPCTRETPALHSHRRDAQAAGRSGLLVWLQ